MLLQVSSWLVEDGVFDFHVIGPGRAFAVADLAGSQVLQMGSRNAESVDKV